jgi:hypothetical protein
MLAGSQRTVGAAEGYEGGLSDTPGFAAFGSSYRASGDFQAKKNLNNLLRMGIRKRLLRCTARCS